MPQRRQGVAEILYLRKQISIDDGECSIFTDSSNFGLARSVYRVNFDDMSWRLIVLSLASLIVGGCTLSPDETGLNVFVFESDFNEGQDQWVAGFTDYPAGEWDSAAFELKFEYTQLPSPLHNRRGMMLSGNNHSEDLFMFVKRKVSGLSPETVYALNFDVELASNAPTGPIDAGGAPGENVYLKAGASSLEPKKVVDGGTCVLNIDKGNQSTGGEDLIVLGNIGVAPGVNDYTLIERSSAEYNYHHNTPFMARTNSKGELWLIVGTDSGFEGTTTLYYTRINIVFSSNY